MLMMLHELCALTGMTFSAMVSNSLRELCVKFVIAMSVKCPVLLELWSNFTMSNEDSVPMMVSAKVLSVTFLYATM